jgi:hypothetical protein
MILPALNIIRAELNNNVPPISTELASIGEVIANNAQPNNNPDIIISLVNVEENRISRDPRNYLKSGNDVFPKNPAVHLYLTLLFTATRSDTSYTIALQNLQRLINFFQNRYVFDNLNTQGLDKLIMEMVSINLEQLNHLWSIAGGRYQPSVVYKMRMVTIDTAPGPAGNVIKEIENKYYRIDIS